MSRTPRVWKKKDLTCAFDLDLGKVWSLRGDVSWEKMDEMMAKLYKEEHSLLWRLV